MMAARRTGSGRSARTIAKAAAASTLAATLALALPSSALAVSISDLFTLGPLDFVAAFLTELAISAVQVVLVPLCQIMFNWGTDFLTIPMVNKVILALQGFALVAAVAVRVSVGVSEGVFLRGGNKERSNGEYLFKSIVALALVALMPMICRTIISLGIAIANGMGFGSGGENSIATMLGYFTLGDDFNWSEEIGSASIAAGLLWTIVGLLAMLTLAVACGYQFVRRQIEMLVVSIIAPVVSVYAATENDSDQVWNLLRQLFGLVCMQWLQYLLVVIAMNFGIAWIEKVFQTADLLPFTEVPATYFMFCVATFGAALTIPDLVNRYTFGNGGSKTGGLVTSFAVNRALGSTGKLAGKGVHRVTGAAGGFAAGVAAGARGASGGSGSGAPQRTAGPSGNPSGPSGPGGGSDGSGAAAGDTANLRGGKPSPGAPPTAKQVANSQRNGAGKPAAKTSKPNAGQAHGDGVRTAHTPSGKGSERANGANGAPRQPHGASAQMPSPGAPPRGKGAPSRVASGQMPTGERKPGAAADRSRGSSKPVSPGKPNSRGRGPRQGGGRSR